MFLLRELARFIYFTQRKKIGFIFGGWPLPYSSVMASTRLHVYDIIDGFRKDEEFFVEIFKPWKQYDIVIFQKKFDEKARMLAEKLKNRGVKIILDINVNYYDRTILKENETSKHNEIMAFTAICDIVITTSDYIRDFVIKLFPAKKIICIAEGIPDEFFKVKKFLPSFKDSVKFVFSGYAVKAKEILLVQDHLVRLAKEFPCEYLFICEKNPHITIEDIKVTYIKYHQSTIPRLLASGDIFLSPRDLNNPYNFGHSFTKVGSPMAVGLPVIASHLMSYDGSPAVLLDNFGVEWYNEIIKLITDQKYYTRLSDEGIQFCYKNYKMSSIIAKYKDIFK